MWASVHVRACVCVYNICWFYVTLRHSSSEVIWGLDQGILDLLIGVDERRDSRTKGWESGGGRVWNQHVLTAR